MYVNKIATLGRESLIRQLSKTIDSGRRLNYLTKEEVNDSLEDIETLNNMNGLSRSLVKIYDFAANNITKLTDKYLPKSEYYHYREPSEILHIVRALQILNFANVTSESIKLNKHGKLFLNFDYELNQVFFDDLNIRKPDYSQF